MIMIMESEPKVSPFFHLPVLAQLVLDAAQLLPVAEGVLIDATLGGGGHSALLLERHPGLRLVGLDQDPAARAAAAERLPAGIGWRGAASLGCKSFERGPLIAEARNSEDLSSSRTSE